MAWADRSRRKAQFLAPARGVDLLQTIVGALAYWKDVPEVEELWNTGSAS